MKTRALFCFVCLFSLLSLLAACAPEYPACTDDTQCEEKGEFCLDNKCAQCRDDAHCKGSCSQCSDAGQCEKKPNCCAGNNDCPYGLICRNKECSTGCLDTCSAGFVCEQAQCVRAPECRAQKDCPPQHTCHNSMCIGPSPCENGVMRSVYFDFDESVIRKDQQMNLIQNVECIAYLDGKFGDRISVHLVGHADEIGPEDYNVELGHDRAKAIFHEVIKLGVKQNRLTTDSRGKYEPAIPCNCKEEKNRRVEFKQK